LKVSPVQAMARPAAISSNRFSFAWLGRIDVSSLNYASAAAGN
jgi:hypothetical protein